VSSRRLVVFALAAAVVLSGCLTGQRPTLEQAAVGGEPGTSTGDPAVDAVLVKLERSERVVFTAGYTITRAVGGVVTQASVTQDASRLSITIGRVRFLDLGDQQTCKLDLGTCESGFLDARVSDTGVQHAFYREAAARRLRVAVTRKTGPTVAHQEASIAGYPAVCVDVPLGAGAETYCSNDLDVVARWTAADISVELTTLGPAASDDLFSVTG